MPEIRWLFRPTPDPIMVKNFMKETGADEIAAYLLVQRGVTNYEEARLFFNPRIEHLHDPFLMKDMDKAVLRLEQAFENNEKIMIYGDYDVDGTTSVALVYQFFKRVFPDKNNFDFYIPDRYKEGYGISKQGIDYAKENGFTLMIALDCGIKSIELVEYAKSKGIDFIICDHHLPGAKIPNAVAVLDPKRHDCQYPYKELSGCGVGFKLLQGFSLHKKIEQEHLHQFLDLVVVSIACDIVPITGENRVLAYCGLDKLNSKPLRGLRKLREVAGFGEDKAMSITNVVFGIGPRINAAGRIEHARNAVKVLLAENEEEAKRFAEIIHEHNQDRKDLDKSITQEALQMIEAQNLQNAKTTVLFKPDWHKGVIGIVASRCIEHYHRPTIILTQSNGKIAGSARSVHDFDVYEAIEACADLLEQFGGHKHAAGLTLKPENLRAFQEKFEQVVASRIKPEQLSPHLEVDMKLLLKDATDKFMRILNQLAPFGPGNMQPLFMSESVKAIPESVTFVGKDEPKIHLKFKVRQENSAVFDCIAFGMGHLAEKIQTGEPFHICYHLEENHFRDNTTLQLRIKDIKW
ncbi:single-stranded-DNA-specific exonuclease RecJ [Raineya orbicola]|jgi:single-stranded-DNA-specific exonuclease|uniref:Single-stranded-DNA-specific exonuclease RecJ n=1 Tax=Raineya orbicola TaxID=2016530 RepID=A0A2N3IKI0_9BACT|nr:single-stranded-DNA-specific exonuclease RecJ [Raineya orbicola]PKQ70791.1 recJ: single-stranded-DNA-specific exonuclease RecJ [Raineya orbicola]